MGEMLKLREYQTEAIEAVRQAWASGLRRPAVVLPTGAGKTVVFAHVAEIMHRRGVKTLILAHRDELIEQAAGKLRAVAPDLRVGIYKADRREVRGRDVIVASVQSLARAERRAELARAGVRLVIIDECFPVGTMVGERRIEDLRPGDLVPSWDEASGKVVSRPVVRVMRRVPSSMVELTFEDGGKLCCTPNHPLLTDKGWCTASLSHGASVVRFTHDAIADSYTVHGLRSAADTGGSASSQSPSGDTAVLRARLRSRDAAARRDGAALGARNLMHRVFTAGELDPETQDRRLETVRPRLLLGQLSRHLGGPRRVAAALGDQQAARLGSHEDAQPNGATGVAQEDERHLEEDRPPAAAGWQRSWAHRAAARALRVLGLGDRSADHHQRRGDALGLLRGHRASDDEGDRRGGRGIPLLAGAPRRRPSQGRSPGLNRVVDVQVLEQGRDGTYGGVCRGGAVYNIEVAGTHTYLVNDGVVAHNCHHAVANTYMEVLRDLGAFEEDPLRGAYALGVTATLGRTDKVALNQVWQDVVYKRDIIDMIREGFLVNPKGIRVKIDGLDLSKVKRNRGDFAEGALADAMHAALAPKAIARAYVEHAAERQGILFAPTVELAYEMAEALASEGIPAAGIDGAMALGDRRKALAGFARGDIQVVTNCMVLTEGFDAPWCSAVVIARPTSSAPLYVQMAGRALRPHPGKRDAIILDVVGVTGRHRLASVVDLAGADRVEKLDDDLAQYDEIDLLGLADGGMGLGRPDKARLDGPLTHEIVDLFTSSRRAWLRTQRGVWFLSAGENLIFLAPGSTPGAYSVARCPSKKAGGEFLRQDVDLEMAMSWGEQLAAGEIGVLTARSASWRKAVPGDRQLIMAASLGIDSNGMTKGELSDAISHAIASQRIDAMPCVSTVTERSYW